MRRTIGAVLAIFGCLAGIMVAWLVFFEATTWQERLLGVVVMFFAWVLGAIGGMIVAEEGQDG